ncbi:hypothetical protein N2152v2_010367 [Parachlorella kessleri]
MVVLAPGVTVHLTGLRPWLGSLGTKRPSRRGLIVVAVEKCLYQTLGVSRAASKADIKAAYRRLARIYHPDANPVSLGPEKFQAITQAYEVLSDEERRQAYDEFGVSGQTTVPRRNGSRFEQAGAPGSDVHAVLAISLQEAALGSEREVQVAVLASCPDCDGIGAAAGSQAPACGVCRGAGEFLKNSTVNPYGMQLRSLVPCPACQGRGFAISQTCRGCAGHGMRRQRRRLHVRVPPGVDEGSVLRLKGIGDLGQDGAPAGDVHVRFELKDQKGMQREGRDLHSPLAVSLWDALLGGPAVVQTLRGRATLQVPPGTQHGATLSLPQQGLPRLGGPAAATGAHHFKVSVMLPHAEAMGEAEQQLLGQLACLRRARDRRQQPQHAWHGEQQAQQLYWHEQRQDKQPARRRRAVRGQAGRQTEDSEAVDPPCTDSSAVNRPAGGRHGKAAAQQGQHGKLPSAAAAPAHGSRHVPLPGEQGVLRRSRQPETGCA